MSKEEKINSDKDHKIGNNSIDIENKILGSDHCPITLELK